MISYLQENKPTKQSGMIFLLSVRKGRMYDLQYPEETRAYTDRQHIQTVWGSRYTFDPNIKGAVREGGPKSFTFSPRKIGSTF